MNIPSTAFKRPSLKVIIATLGTIVVTYAVTVMVQNLTNNPFAHGDPFNEFIPQMYLFLFMVIPILVESVLLGTILAPRGNQLLLAVATVSAFVMGVLMTLLARNLTGPWFGVYNIGFFWQSAAATFTGMTAAAYLSRKGW